MCLKKKNKLRLIEIPPPLLPTLRNCCSTFQLMLLLPPYGCNIQSIKMQSPIPLGEEKCFSYLRALQVTSTGDDYLRFNPVFSSPPMKQQQIVFFFYSKTISSFPSEMERIKRLETKSRRGSSFLAPRRFNFCCCCCLPLSVAISRSDTTETNQRPAGV